jgi:cytochrome oxidase Cu insertion factor (SCO1/SenC/PrrC family)
MRFTRQPGFLGACLLWAASLSAHAQDIFHSPGPWWSDSAQSFDIGSLQGTPTVVTMAYGACRKICSTSLRVLEKVQALADEKNLRLNFVVVSLDPQQDKPADWAAFRVERKLTRANWRFLSGDAASTRELARRLNVRYWRYGEHTMHDFKIVLLSADGKLLRSMEAFDDSPARLLP